MGPISRDSLPWHTAVKTFFSIVFAGLVMLAITGYLYYALVSTTALANPFQLAYLLLAIPALLILAALFAFYNYGSLFKALDDLEQITHSMPLLSSKKYDDARLIFNNVGQHAKYREIIDLQAAVLQLASILEGLDANVSQRSQMIHSKTQELRSERDFIKSLLDTAQLIILTINQDFEITMLNDYGEKIIGYPERDMLHSEVARVFPAGNWLEAQTHFNELLSGNMQIAQQDSELVNKAGQIKHISWLHSRMDNNSQDAVILSVGLDMTEKKEAEKRVVWMAEHDPLTDLCNRRKFMEEFDKSLRTAIRYQHQSCLLFLDLDQFKDINDTSGHSAGDDLLKLVAKTLKRTTRYTDLVARLGGDEFAILMPECDEEGAKILSRKIIDELSAIQLTYGTVKHKVSTSIGIVHYPLHDADVHELMGFADLAMYKAKASGKGTFHTFSPDDQTRDQLETRVFWKHQIEQALEEHLFILHYQPILELETDTIKHYEVLIRMRDSHTNEIRMPGKFIEIAEEVGLIQSIDHYVMQHAMIKLAKLEQQGVPVKLAINLSGSVIDAPVLLPFIKKLINKTEINPANLIFEVTETAAVSNLQQAKLMMTAIKALGCQFSLDDFGVGFASFNYMRQLPVDIIKIDGIFIKDLHVNEDDQLFVRALIDVAKGLGRKTIAEFVENEQIMSLLRSYGVDYAQGYYIGRPEAEIRQSADWQPSEETITIIAPEDDLSELTS